jgi:hypothetical protein
LVSWLVGAAALFLVVVLFAFVSRSFTLPSFLHVQPGQDEVEYSDDEQEMLARQARKQALGRGRAAAAGE